MNIFPSIGTVKVGHIFIIFLDLCFVIIIEKAWFKLVDFNYLQLRLQIVTFPLFLNFSSNFSEENKIH